MEMKLDLVLSCIIFKLFIKWPELKILKIQRTIEDFTKNKKKLKPRPKVHYEIKSRMEQHQYKPWHKVSHLKDGHIMIYYSSLVTLWSINVSFMIHILLVYQGMGHIGGQFCGKLSLGMLDKPILLITFCVNFHQKALKKGVGGKLWIVSLIFLLQQGGVGINLPRK